MKAWFAVGHPSAGVRKTLDGGHSGLPGDGELPRALVEDGRKLLLAPRGPSEEAPSVKFWYRPGPAQNSKSDLGEAPGAHAVSLAQNNLFYKRLRAPNLVDGRGKKRSLRQRT